MIEVDANKLCDLIRQPYIVGERADLRNRRVQGPVDIKDSSLCGVDLSGSVFTHRVEIIDSVFEGLSWFKGVEFHAPVSFAGSRFSNDARFDTASFGDTADFSSVVFWGVGCFDRTQAQGHVDMSDVTAYGNLSLAGGHFAQALQLRQSVLMGGLWMPKCDPADLEGVEHCDVFGRIESRDTRESARRFGQ
ncbi:MAG: pentapeptide repeat-containing protein [Granulosicoccus sp.]|nr:pentapeptide repeat-containing protein [Granulosicoccus sp.]